MAHMTPDIAHDVFLRWTHSCPQCGLWAGKAGCSQQTTESSSHLEDQESLDAKCASDCWRRETKGRRKVILEYLSIGPELARRQAFSMVSEFLGLIKRPEPLHRPLTRPKGQRNSCIGDSDEYKSRFVDLIRRLHGVAIDVRLSIRPTDSGQSQQKRGKGKQKRNRVVFVTKGRAKRS
jgi:hypothetical protein